MSRIKSWPDSPDFPDFPGGSRSPGRYARARFAKRCPEDAPAIRTHVAEDTAV
jgi:hypothetical protein